MSDSRRILTRRSMLASGWAALAGAALSGTRAVAAVPEDSRTAAPLGSEIRTLVCIYLLGGSDGNSLVAPLEPSQYNAWAKARGELGLEADSLLPIRARSTGSAYGLDPRLPQLRKLFNDGSAAVVANVGPAVRPSGADRYGSLAFLRDGYAVPAWAARATGAGIESDIEFTFGNGVGMVPIGKSAFAGERRKNPALMDQIASASFRASFPDSVIGRQAKIAAGLIKAGNVAGAPGQVILCPFGGFGTSTAQMIMKAPLYAQLSAAMAALYQATVEMGMEKQVTIYTDSEFGRTLRPNGKHGSDPGWGNHHFVLGGAVQGGDIYGQYPDMVSGAFDKDSALIPTTSSAQYYAALARWVGIAPNELPSILPGLSGKVPQLLPV